MSKILSSEAMGNNILKTMLEKKKTNQVGGEKVKTSFWLSASF